MKRRAYVCFCGWLAVASILASTCSSAAPLVSSGSGSQSPIPNQQSPINYSPTPTFTPFQPMELGTQEISTSTATPIAGPISQELEPHVTQQPVDSQPGEAPTVQPLPSTGTLSLWVDPYLPAALREALAIPPEFVAIDSPESAVLRLEVSDQHPISNWVYVLVAPFATIPEGVSLETLGHAWRGEAGVPFVGRPLLMEEGTLRSFTTLWGAPASQAVHVLPAQGLLDHAWKNNPSWAIVPFEALDPRWKVLSIDGRSPIRKDFDPATYALSVPISLNGDSALAEATRTIYGQTLIPTTNRDPGHLTVLAMTGVTALVRATAFAMERSGIEYPARQVGDWLRSADLTHISNEVPFAKDCPYPDPFQPGMRFCSDPRYIGLLETVGTDVVELTGDHFQDWGTGAMHYTLQLYQERGWGYFGGGANLEEARQALTMEHNGNRLAFIGCNAKGGSYAQASANHPGAVACDYDWMQGEITRLRDEGYLPVVTFQHFEYYTYRAQPDQVRDFRSMAKAGAVIVSGSQAHQPQALEFTANALIHYGLGNLFFDQYEVSLATRQAFIDRHIFYNGRHISTELLPILFVDYARPRPMTPAERQELLEAIFAASGW